MKFQMSMHDTHCVETRFFLAGLKNVIMMSPESCATLWKKNKRCDIQWFNGTAVIIARPKTPHTGVLVAMCWLNN